MRIIEGENDHLPLPGPWNRPRGGNRGPAEGAPGQPGGGPYRSGEEEEDRPLPGPWSRREHPSNPGQPAPGTPPEVPQDQPPEPGQEPAQEKRPEPGPRPRPKLPREPPPEQESPRPAEDAGSAAGPAAREAGPAPAPAAEVGEAAGGEICGRPVEKVERPIRDGARSPEEYMRKIFSPGGVYAGIVMAEILGSRGGRPRRR